VRPRERGLTLAEVCLSLLLLALTVWSLQALYIRLLVAGRQADANQEAVAAFETILDVVRHQVRSDWPAISPPDPTTSWSGSLGVYAYQVDDWGRVRDPLEETTELYLPMKKVEIVMTFTDKRTRAPRSMQAVLSVVR